jgi:hypothetical protein
VEKNLHAFYASIFSRCDFSGKPIYRFIPDSSNRYTNASSVVSVFSQYALAGGGMRRVICGVSYRVFPAALRRVKFRFCVRVLE